jgi:hypothetical protein
MLRQVFRNYRAWRVFAEDAATKINKFTPKATSVYASPSKVNSEQLSKVFGPPNLRFYTESSGGFDFEDQNFDSFLVYEQHSTSATVKEHELTKQFIKPSLKGLALPLPTYEEFWNSSELKEFRVRTM